MRQHLSMLDRRTSAEMAKLAHGHAERAQAGRKRARQAARERRVILAEIVEQDVLPQLSQFCRDALASCAAGRSGVDAAAAVIRPEHVVALTDLVLVQDELAALAYVDALRRRGAVPEAVYLDLLAPAALRLGVFWEEDICDFTQVTMGLWRLQTVMRELSPAFLAETGHHLTGPRIVLVPLPGAQHTFGLSMVFDFFLRAGWDAWCGTVASSRELASKVSGEWVDVIGFSVACSGDLDAARAEIDAVRRASRNPAIAVLVGGPAIVGRPEAAALLGADAAASDARHAIVEAWRLMGRSGAGRRRPA